jgi:hypothetical protein
VPMRPLTEREIDAIRDRRSDMSTQLNSAVNRRNDLAGELRSAPAGTEQGILARIQLLDDRILQIERDIESSGQMLRSGMVANDGTALVAPVSGIEQTGLREETITIFGIAFAFTFLLPMSIGFMKLMFRRARRRDVAAAQPSAEQVERMSRIEQAVDAVALEVERVGEAQRYQARVLAEANLMPALAPGQMAAEPIRARDYHDAHLRYPDR